jgi:hypothetical protein
MEGNMFIALQQAYEIKRLFEGVKRRAKASDDKKLQNLLNQALTRLYEGFDREKLEKIGSIKKLSSKQLLARWYSYYSMLPIDVNCHSWRVLNEMGLYAQELMLRGMYRDMEKLKRPLDVFQSASSERKFVQVLQRMTDAELLAEYDYYLKSVPPRCHKHEGYCQKKRLIELQLGKRGINEAKGEHSEQSYN